MKSTSFSRHIQDVLTQQRGEPVAITAAEPVHGGSINECFRISTTAGNFFLKRNDAVEFPGMFTAEADGLHALAATKAVKVPSVIATGSHRSHSYLILEFLEKGKASPDFWENFGSALADLHRCTGERFGWPQDNYIGSIPQMNTQWDSWSGFYTSQRLEPMARLALDSKKISGALYDRLQKVYERLIGLFPNEAPSLLHGDLWSGNFMPVAGGAAALFDPAVYYGHREMDLAMARLFGGFEKRFFDAYLDAFPLQSGWEKRIDLCQLYPLLVHVNLFKGGYVHQVEMIVRRWE